MPLPLKALPSVRPDRTPAQQPEQATTRHDIVSKAFKDTGLQYPDMKWRLEGRKLTTTYPDLGDAASLMYPGPGEYSATILFIAEDEAILGSKAGRSVEFRIKSNAPQERELAAESP